MEKMGDVINANIEKELMRKLEKDYIHEIKEKKSKKSGRTY